MSIMEERRKSFRTRVRWPVTIATSQGSTEGETKDVSGSGAFIYCDRPLNENERCLIKMQLPDGRVPEIAAKVVWSTAPGPNPDDELDPRGMGVRFLW